MIEICRDHDELRHSFRSVLQHFRTHVNSFTLFTSDFPFPVEADAQSLLDAYEEEDGYEDEDEYAEKRDAGSDKQSLRVGLRPSWLTSDARGWMDENVELGLQFQSEVWDGYAGTSFNRCVRVALSCFFPFHSMCSTLACSALKFAAHYSGFSLS